MIQVSARILIRIFVSRAIWMEDKESDSSESCEQASPSEGVPSGSLTSQRIVSPYVQYAVRLEHQDRGSSHAHVLYGCIGGLVELGAHIRTRINRIRPLTKVSKRTEERDFALSFFEYFKTEACMLRPQRAALPSALLASGFTLHLPRLLWPSAVCCLLPA